MEVRRGAQNRPRDPREFRSPSLACPLCRTLQLITSVNRSIQNPPLVFGPILHEVEKVENLNTSVGIFWDVIDGKLKESDLPGGGGGDCIDVRERT